MEKNLDYYMQLPYTFELQEDPEAGWFVRVKELPGCMSQGDTAAEAMEMIQEAMQLWIEVSLEDGDPIPEPRSLEDYSGKFLVRVPRSLHQDLVDAAEGEEVSLNRYINVALARSVGRRGPASPPEQDRPNWPGLSAAARQALQAAGLDREAGELDERLLADWIDKNLRQAESALEQGLLGEVRWKLESLATCLCAGMDASPIMVTLHRSVTLLCQQVEALEQLQRGVINDLLMRERIREQTAASNRFQARGAFQSERTNYSEATTPRAGQDVFQRFFHELEGQSGWEGPTR